MRKSVGRPKKKPGSGKTKATLSLNPTIYRRAKEQCYEDGVSVSEKIDRLLEAFVNSAKKKGEKHIEKATEAVKRGDKK